MSYIPCDSQFKKSVRKIRFYLDAIYEESLAFGIENPVHKDKWIEMIVCAMFDENCSITSRGSDAENEVEIKSCQEGGSFQYHWISKNKDGKVKETKKLYCAIRNGSHFPRIYLLEGNSLRRVIKEVREKSAKDGSINAHKNFSEDQIIKFGAKLVGGDTIEEQDSITRFL